MKISEETPGKAEPLCQIPLRDKPILWIGSRGTIAKNLLASAPVPGRDSLTAWSSQSDRGDLIIHGQP